ncbi:hypothetical protein ACH4C1_18735 [Streptomyces sp. NPDC017849]|uniref:hypothetical protein n=1 Tax=Streptomyces sp. NPDC017849 TaxID=3365008 RepID=UPI003792DE4C
MILNRSTVALTMTLAEVLPGRNAGLRTFSDEPVETGDLKLPGRLHGGPGKKKQGATKPCRMR